MFAVVGSIIRSLIFLLQVEPGAGSLLATLEETDTFQSTFRPHTFPDASVRDINLMTADFQNIMVKIKFMPF